MHQMNEETGINSEKLLSDLSFVLPSEMMMKLLQFVYPQDNYIPIRATGVEGM